MGRHTPTRHAQSTPPRRRGLPVAVAVVTVLALAAVVWVVTRPSGATTPAADAEACRVDAAVRVTVVPEIGALVRDQLAGPIPIGGYRCAVAEVRTEPPLQTSGVLAGSDLGTQPQIWVPDDVSWATRAGATVDADGTELGQTSLVVATSRAVADGLGWSTTPPTWAEAAGRAVLPGPSEAAGLIALAALQSSAGPGELGDTAVVQAVVSAGRAGTGTEQALAAAVAGADDAPVVVATEQQVAAASADGAGDLAVVVPSEGAPVLSLPVLRTAAGRGDPAVDAVLERLAATAADGTAVRDAGWRDTTGRAAGDAAQPPVWELAADAVAALPGRLADLATPSRLLTVVDTSASMDAALGEGTRATLARDALTSALAVLPDRTVGGLWVFAARLDGAQDWRELVPLRPFGTPVDGQTQRELLADRFGELPDLLTAGGTGLYDTALAAVRSARESYDPGAVNTVVLLTDGTDDDPSGIGEDELLATLAAEVDPARPVQVVAVGIGPDADQGVLQRIAEATGGAAYPAVEADDLQTVLFEALQNR
ncbi:VWA domain-containing protein [Klenkia terrae]|uniref:VWA domain-containing protein n=1 Tax=Klenkia terrae TaxID=1052259 RepID=A0ABU8E0J9_9ACTN|nr:VWA domain-containing protein [Klenkia terrae]SSC24252.1 von Willebrand factor type A domain-containing protein [Klenkia terrae]